MTSSLVLDDQHVEGHFISEWLSSEPIVMYGSWIELRECGCIGSIALSSCS